MSATRRARGTAAALIATAVAAGLVLAACAGIRARGAPAGPGPTRPDPGGFSLTVADAGGFVAPQALLRRVPAFALLADGTAVAPGPQIEIYPGPALPNMVARRIGPAGLRAILRAATGAGLLGPSRSITLHGVADATTTTFTLVRAGTTHRVSVYALDAAPHDPGLSASQRAEAGRLVHLRDALGDLERWLPKGSVGPEAPYRPTGLLVFAARTQGTKDLPVAPPAEGQAPARWPLPTPLGRFGAPFGPMAGLRCATVTGLDLRALLPALRRANELTPWQSGGRSYSLVARPLLPGEPGCTGLAA
jgi:hypothetical protein